MPPFDFHTFISCEDVFTYYYFHSTFQPLLLLDRKGSLGPYNVLLSIWELAMHPI
jgi:hypothetical protein